MYIHFSEAAVEALTNRLPEGAILRLFYDTEGCGCALAGVAALHIQAVHTEGDVEAQSNAFTVQYDPRKEVFFEENLSVDYMPQRGTYVLKSSQQTYNPAMRLVNCVN
ncbi:MULTISPECIES: iron-sulfur cluster biosynthesis family protein [Paenibacillus]|uniref:iron-sulfur cluster biosynthesis family protein n=1 Tax=Paenibacillus TaxID=44249 RepID=UPI001C2FCC7A|nr:iron-sulfur cluster biosynthesis family protein [Paenibacillus sp. GbtcB18]